MATTTKTQLETLEKKIDQHMNQAATADMRMSRIEEKLDQLADAVVSIARAEEKIAVLIQDTRDIKLTLNDTYNRLHKVEIDTMSNMSDLKTLNKFFWLIATTTITVAATAFAVSLGIL
jgi:septation ring formation regulator EzrA